jgi:hypothetical protein
MKLPSKVYNLLVARDFKSQGTRFLTLLTDGPTAKSVLIETEELHVADLGYGFILSPESNCFLATEED